MGSSLAAEVGAEAAARIERLADAAEKKRLDPEAALDWSEPLDGPWMHMPEEFSPLAGTPERAALDAGSRRRLSLHEAASMLGTGIWFENLLINALARHNYNLTVDDPLFRFLLVEIEEECRHSLMFGEYIRRARTPPYRPSWWLRLQGKGYWLIGSRVVFYLSILGTEEILHGMTDCAWHAPDTHPALRELMRIHTVEEQRHMAFAREYLSAAFPRLGFLGRWYARLFVPIVLYTVVQASVDPAVYRTVGIPDGHRAAWRNPVRRARVVKSLARYASFCRQIGVITPTTSSFWKALGLVGLVSDIEK